MDEAALVFVHSPLVGPLTWQAVADAFAAAGRRAAVPDLTGDMAGSGPYLPRIARTVAAVAARVGGPVVLIGHSGAGPLLPGIAAGLGGPVEALVYADAGLPYPGRTWSECAPPDLVRHLHGLAAHGWLPPWHEWFAPEAITRLVPDPALRERFTGQLAPLPLDYFQERMPAATWPGRAGYLLLSEAYRDEAGRAAEQGMPVVEHLRDHLAPLTCAAAVARALREVLARLGTMVG